MNTYQIRIKRNTAKGLYSKVGATVLLYRWNERFNKYTEYTTIGQINNKALYPASSLDKWLKYATDYYAVHSGYIGRQFNSPIEAVNDLIGQCSIELPCIDSISLEGKYIICN